jgi:hypothetical protein
VWKARSRARIVLYDSGEKGESDTLTPTTDLARFLTRERVSLPVQAHSDGSSRSGIALCCVSQHPIRVLEGMCVCVCVCVGGREGGKE